MPEGNPLSYVLLLIVLIGCNAFFAMSELAVIGLNDAKLARMAEDGDRRPIFSSFRRVKKDEKK